MNYRILLLRAYQKSKGLTSKELAKPTNSTIIRNDDVIEISSDPFLKRLLRTLQNSKISSVVLYFETMSYI